MASSSSDGERRYLGQFARQKSKYGSTSKNLPRKEKIIQHTVQPTDTLQGLALRYGVTMEEIKRTNKLWTTDSLFLRTQLSIPVPNDFSVSPNSSETGTPATSPTKTTRRKQSGGEESQAPSSELFDNNSLESQQREESMEDFLIRIDSSIAQTRNKVKQLDHSTLTRDEINEPVAWRYPPSSRHYKENGYKHSSYAAADDATDCGGVTPQVPVVMTQGRKVVSSLKRLEREQDEIFEL